MNPHTLSMTDRTSWYRVAMIGRYFLPVLRVKLITFPLLSALIFLLAHSLDLAHGSMPAIALVGMASYLVALGPLVFAKHRAMEMFASLPALGLEKCIFVLAYTLIAIPLMVYGPMVGLMYLCYGADCPDLLALNGVTPITNVNMQIFSLLNVGAEAVTCLWVVWASSTYRALRAVLAVMGVIGVNFVTGAVMGFLAAMNLGPDLAAGEVVNGLGATVAWINPILIIYIIFALWMACRAIARRQI